MLKNNSRMCIQPVGKLKTALTYLLFLVLVFTATIIFNAQDQITTPSLLTAKSILRHKYSIQQSTIELNLESSKYVYYQCAGKTACGGFGDRQKGIVGAYLISLMMKRRFAIWFTKPCNLNKMLEPNFVDWDIDPSIFKNKTFRNIIAIDGDSAQLRNEMRTIDLEKTYPEDILYFALNLEFVRFIRQNTRYSKQLKWLKHLSISEIYDTVWHRLFKLKPRLQTTLKQFHQLKERGLQLIGAQIRLGRNPSVPNDSEMRNNITNMHVLWDFYQKYNDSSKYRIFITSDSKDVTRIAKQRFPDVYIDIPGEVVHIERTIGKQVCSGFQKVILDQMVLGQCDVLVVSKSGFGRIGAFFRQNENNLYCMLNDSISRCTTQSPRFVESSW